MTRSKSVIVTKAAISQLTRRIKGDQDIVFRGVETKKPSNKDGFFNMVEGGGFEPPKAEPSDLQSDPFGHSGTPPAMERILPKLFLL